MDGIKTAEETVKILMNVLNEIEVNDGFDGILRLVARHARNCQRDSRECGDLESAKEYATISIMVDKLGEAVAKIY